MPVFVAMLRGVNVGRAKRIPMADLRALLSKLDYTRVATVLNSGNAVFCATRRSSATHARSIAAAIAGTLGIEVPVVVKSAREFASIVAENPLGGEGTDPSRLLVALAQDPNALPGLAAIGKLLTPPERFVLGRHAAYLLCACGIRDSKAAAALLGKAGRFATTRNWATVSKLQALVSLPDAMSSSGATVNDSPGRLPRAEAAARRHRQSSQ